MVRILGIDPGTESTGWSVLNGWDEFKDIQDIRIEQFGVMKTKKADGDLRKRVDMLGEQLTEIIKAECITHVAFEDFVQQGVRAGMVLYDMATLLEHFRMVSRSHSIEPRIYPNAEWKQRTLGSRQPNKKQVQHYVTNKLPEAARLLQGQPDHVWDSVGIGYCLWKELIAN